MTGQQFNSWTVLSKSDKTGQRNEVYWHVRCVCGNEKDVRANSLTMNKSKSCGCLSYRKKSLLGAKFGKWTVIDGSDLKVGRHSAVKCQCECGAIKVIVISDLKGGRTTQCVLCRATFQPRKTGDALGAREVWRAYALKSNRRDLPFELTFEQFYEMSQQNCYYCNEGPSNYRQAPKEHATPFIYNGIDRVDSRLGYIQSNVVTSCWVCNSSKKTDSLEDFLSWIEKVYKFNKELGRIP